MDTYEVEAGAERALLRVAFLADRGLGFAWVGTQALWALLPAGFALAMGGLVGAVQRDDPLGAPLAVAGGIFIALNAISPLQEVIGTNLGAKIAAYLHDRLLEASTDPPGLAHLEDPELADQLSTARDFDIGIAGPPIIACVPQIGSGVAQLMGAMLQVAILATFRWWAAVLIGVAWGSTHWTFKKHAIWRGREDPDTVLAQRQAHYAYRMAVEAPAAKEMRIFGLADWTVDRFAGLRRTLLEKAWLVRRLHVRTIMPSVVGIVIANVIVFWALADAASNQSLSLAAIVVYAQATIGASFIAFGEFDWWLRTAAQPVPIVMRLAERMRPVGALSSGTRDAGALPAHSIEFRDVHFQYPSVDREILKGFNLTVPAGRSLAIVGQNGAGKTTLMKLLCRLYDPTQGSVLVDGIDLRDVDLDSWRRRLAAVFQDFVRYELSLRENVAPTGADDETVLAALGQAQADHLTDLDTILSKSYKGGTDLSGGQWQRLAVARALCAVSLGAGVVILDEPTAQLDVRGELEIFDRILTATKGCTTILISHRFSTVRHADVICVLEDGEVVETGSHAELIALGGRYRTMFDLQASRFEEDDDVISLDDEVEEGSHVG